MRIAVIGGGISGVAAASVLQREGHEVVVFERSPVAGGVWAKTYPSVTLQNSAPQYHIADFPWPFEPDLHPTAEQVRRYIAAAIEHFKVDVRHEHEVTALAELAEGERGWTVAGRGPDGPFSTAFEFVLLAVGQYTQPKVAHELPGRERFAGEVLTEAEVESAARFAGKRVAVVGFGKSAVDIAKLASEAGATSVTHVFRTARWLLPLYLLGVHASFALLTRAGSVMMTSWAHPHRAEEFLHTRLRPLVDGFWTTMGEVFWMQHRSVGLRRGAAGRARLRRLRPKHPMIQDMRSAAALAPAGYFRAVADGSIEPVHAELLGFTPTGLRVREAESGSERELACDQVVFSLGSRSPTFPFMPPRYRTLLEAEPDGVQLYRHLIHPQIPNLAFAGYSHGFLHIPMVEVGTLWLSAMLAGELELPAVEVMEQTIDRVRAWKRAHVTFEPSRGCGVSTRYQQYLDIMLQDLGFSRYRKPNPIAEVFGRYGASDYAGLIAAYQARRAAGPLRLQPVALDS